MLIGQQYAELKHKKILFMHPNLPAQFKYLIPAVVECGADVRGLTFSNPAAVLNILKRPVTIEQAKPLSDSSEKIDPWLMDMDSKVVRARAAREVLMSWKLQGWEPDLVIGHTGWGDMQSVRTVFPSSKVIGWFEYYYCAPNTDLGFDSEFPTTLEQTQKAEFKNLWPLWMLQNVDVGVSATAFQKRVHPEWAWSKLHVIHEGINTDVCVPNEEVTIQIGQNGPLLSRSNKVITFVNRCLEPYRGFHSFIRALPKVLEQHPDAHVLIIGSDSGGYGAQPPKGSTWRQIFLNEVGHLMNPQRVHFLGSVSYDVFLAALQLSKAHVYLTYPFVLSWSMLEAMSCAAPVIGSRTEPVEDVIKHGENGFLVDFFDSNALSETLNWVLSNPDSVVPIRSQARQTIQQQFDLTRVCLPKQLELLIDSVS